MNIDQIKEQLQQEGFAHIYEWTDEPGTIYPPHAHQGKVSIYITNGSVTFDFVDTNEIVTVKEGERFDVPIGKQHRAVVGPEGCSYVVGEEIEGDS